MNKIFSLKWMLAVSLLVSAQAHATTFGDLGIIGESGATFQSGSLASGGFSHDWSFGVSSPSGLVATVNSIKFSGLGASITGVSLLDHAFVTLATGAVSTFSGGGFAAYFGGTAYNTLFSGNTYYLRIAGNVSGSIGRYNGSVSIAAIPEPEEWVMLLVGLGLIAFQVVRAYQSEQKKELMVFA